MAPRLIATLAVTTVTRLADRISSDRVYLNQDDMAEVIPLETHMYRRFRAFWPPAIRLSRPHPFSSHRK